MLDEPVIYPIGLACLAPYLAGHEVHAIDLNGPYEDPYGELARLLGDVKPDVVGVSLRNIKIARPGVHVSALGEFDAAFETIGHAAPGATVVAGGAAWSLYPEVLLKRYEQIDLGIFSEGEEIFARVVNGEPIASIPGINYRKDGRPAATDRPARLDFSRSLGPDYGLFDVDFYRRTPYSIGVQSKRGCALSCVHCSDKFLLGNAIDRRDPRRVVDDIELLARRGVKDIFVADQIFNIPMTHAEAICDEILARGVKVKWLAWFNERQISKTFLEKAWAAGVDILNFSPDSVSAEVLKSLRKNARPEDIQNAILISKEIGARVTYNFMVNGPEESMASLYRLVKFLAWAKWQLGSRLKLHGSFVLAMRIYPHTELREIAVRKGLISEDDDLLEARYYNPAPLRHVVKAGTFFLTAAWKAKQKLRRAIRGNPIPELKDKPAAAA
ncbi:MAG: cobalamin-dependent protein [Acidobacteriota bacterium]